MAYWDIYEFLKKNVGKEYDSNDFENILGMRKCVITSNLKPLRTLENIHWRALKGSKTQKYRYVYRYEKE